MKYDLEMINSISLDQIFTALGLNMRGKDYICPYPHTKPHPIKIYKDKNYCKCFNCNEFKGGPIDVVKYKLGVDFKEAVKWIAETFDINGEQYTPSKNKPKQKIKKETHYQVFDSTKDCTNIDLNNFLVKYETLTKEQKLKMVYTTFYRFSLGTNQTPKYGYYKHERGIQNRYIDKIGYIHQEDYAAIVEKLLSIFPMEDLVEFGLFKDKDGENVFIYNSIQKGGLLLVPSFDLYNNMVTGLMVRPTHPPMWMKENKVKELQLSKTDILKPLPFGLTCEVLKNAKTIYITEGHMDMLSIPGNEKNIVKYGIASPGTYGMSDEMLGLLRNKEIKIIFDQDVSGHKAEYGFVKINGEEIILDPNGRMKLKKIKGERIFFLGLVQRLTLAGVKNISVVRWDKSLGGDINELVINGNIREVFGEQ